MSRSTPTVLTPIRIAGHLLKNRIVSAPMHFHSGNCNEPYPTEESIRFFEERAKAGVGLVTCAGVCVKGFKLPGIMCSWDVRDLNNCKPLAAMADRIHVYGAKCTMEILCTLYDDYSVSDGVSPVLNPDIKGREMPVDKMMEYKEWVVDTAKAIIGCGFDGIMIHMGHGFALSQFMSPYFNKRTDEYGGSRENRCRYSVEILDDIRAAIGPEKIIEVRMSATDLIEGSVDLEEGIKIGEILQHHCDILQVSIGSHTPESMTITHPCGFLPPTPNIYLADAFKKSGKISACKISTIGGIGSVKDAEAILNNGTADLVVIGRSLIADPEWIKKGAQGREDDVRPCVKCMRCHDTDCYWLHTECTVNPGYSIQEALRNVPAPKYTKKVAVVGGGPAGLQAAITACDRGHDVVLFEKTASLGGTLKFTKYVSFKYPLNDYMNYLIHQVGKRNISVRYNVEATMDDLNDFDAVICAIGAEPIIPNIPGIDQAIPVREVFGNEDKLNQTVAIIGGGEIGLETALHLAEKGKEVSIIEMQSEAAPDALPTHRNELLLKINKTPQITVYCSRKCKAVKENYVIVGGEDGEEEIYAESVVICAGMRPRICEVDSMIDATNEFAAAGDCIKARNVAAAVKEAYYASLQL